MLPLNFNSNEAESELKNIVKDLPKDIEVYLVGGALRNAIFRYFHNEVLRQRDYDIVCTKGFDVFLRYLESRDFYDEGKIIKSDQLVMIKPVVKNYNPNDLSDFIAFDSHPSSAPTILKELENNVSLHINGNAINLKYLFDEQWMKHLVSLPGAIEGIQNKQIRINQTGAVKEAVGMFAVIRFMSVGFAPPPQDEIVFLLKQLKHKDKFEKTVAKVWDYVGGEQNARDIVLSLGIEVDIFNKEVVDQL